MKLSKTLTGTIIFTGLAIFTVVRAESNDSIGLKYNHTLFSFIPDSGLRSGKTPASINFSYEPSGSKWGQHAMEEDAFFASMTNHPLNLAHKWRLGIGKGGNIYSFRGPFGEAIPPQEAYEKKTKSIWVDEVWQVVAVDSSKINRDELTPEGGEPEKGEDHIHGMKYFIHQAGSYLHDPEMTEVAYSPTLGVDWDPKKSSLAHLTWGQHAHIPNIYQSGMLVYTLYRDLVQGVIEVTYVIYNFHETDVLDNINTPWGGVRTSSLKYQWLSELDGSLTQMPIDHRYGGGPVKMEDTGGFSAWSEDTDDLSHALSIVYGQDKHFSKLKEEGLTRRNSRIRFGISSRLGAPWTKARDYTVFMTGTYGPIRPGNVFFSRNYFVVGTLEHVGSISKKLVDWVDYGFLDLKAEQTPLLHYSVDHQHPAKIIQRNSKQASDFSLYAWPVNGSKPMLLMRDKQSGAYFISTDPYVNAKTEPFKNPYPKDHEKYETYQNQTTYQHYLTTEYIKILGFIAPEKQRLDEVRQAVNDPKLFRMTAN